MKRLEPVTRSVLLVAMMGITVMLASPSQSLFPVHTAQATTISPNAPQPLAIGTGRVIYLPLIVTTPAMPAPPPTPAVTVSLSTDRTNVDQQRDPLFDLYITVANISQVPASDVVVNVNYDPSTSQLAYWPPNTTAIGNGIVSLQFSGPLAPGDTTIAQLVFQPGELDFNSETLSFTGSYSLASGNSGQTSSTQVSIIGGLPTPPGAFSCSQTQPFPPLGVQPASGEAPSGTQFLFAAFQSLCGYNFAPSELVSFWVNMPDGSVQPLAQVIADDQGNVQQSLDTTGYDADCYSMVASNQSQSNQLVGAFILDSSAGPPACGGMDQQRSAPATVRPTLAPHRAMMGAPGALGGVRGQLTGDGGRPLPDVLVVVHDGASSWPLRSAMTDTNGNYIIPGGLSSGSDQISFFASRSHNPDSAAYADMTTALTITEPAITTLNAGLVRGGTISGQVRSADGAVGLSTVRVHVFDASGQHLAATATTDEQGRYSTAALAPGSYQVRFLPEHASRPGTRAYIGAYYSSEASGEPTPVAVSDATPINGIDTALIRCPTCAVISGHVVGQDTGAALAGVSVMILDVGSHRLAALTRTDASGSYDAVVPSGSYRVCFFTDYAPTLATRAYRRQAATTALSVTAPQTVSGVDATLPRGAQISGHVAAAESGAPLGNIEVIVRDQQGTTVTTAMSSADGSYTTPGLANGSYQIVFQPASGAKHLPYEQATQAVVIIAADLPGVDVTLRQTP